MATQPVSRRGFLKLGGLGMAAAGLALAMATAMFLTEAVIALGFAVFLVRRFRALEG
jgi:hypothetical protein